MIFGADTVEGLPDLPRSDAQAILVAVTAQWGITLAELTGPCRLARLTTPRNAAALLLRARQNRGGRTRSYPEIGVLLGDRDHSTIINAVRRCFDRARIDPGYRAAVERLATGAEPLPLRLMLRQGRLPQAQRPVRPAVEIIPAQALPRGDASPAVNLRAAQREAVDRVLNGREGRDADLLEDDADGLARARGSMALAQALNRERSKACLTA